MFDWSTTFPKKNKSQETLTKIKRGSARKTSQLRLVQQQKLNKVESSISNIVQKQKVKKSWQKNSRGSAQKRAYCVWPKKRKTMTSKTQQQSWNNLKWLIHSQFFLCWKQTQIVMCHYHKFIENDALIQYNKLYLKTLPRN